jgi:hypothetical protein
LAGELQEQDLEKNKKYQQRPYGQQDLGQDMSEIKKFKDNIDHAESIPRIMTLSTGPMEARPISPKPSV